MGAIKKILILGLGFLIIGLKVYSVDNTSTILNKFTKNFLISFEKGDLNSCLSNLFNQLKIYNSQSDYQEMYRTWTKIGIIYYFQENTDEYVAAFDSANAVRYAFKDEWYYVNRSFYFIDKNLALSEKHQSHYRDDKDAFLKKSKAILKYWTGIKKAKTKKRNENWDGQLIEQLKIYSESADTSWFGFGLMNYYLGELYSDFLMPDKSLPYLLRAKICFERCAYYYKSWLYVYYYLLKETYELRDFELRRKYFLEFNNAIESKKISKDRYFLFYWIRGYYYFMNSNHKETISASLEAIKYAKVGTWEENTIIFRLVNAYFFSQDYQKAQEWIDKHKGKETLDLLYYKAICSFMLGKYHIAAKYVSLIKENKLNEPISDVYQKLIKYYRIVNNYKELGKYIKENIFFIKESYGPKHFRLIDLYEMYAYKLWMIDGNISQANLYYQKAIDILTGEENERNIFTLPDIRQSKNNVTLARCIRNSSEAFYELSRNPKNKQDEIKYLNTSLAYYELALVVITKHKSSLFTEDQKLVFTDMIKHYYPNIIQVCMELFEKTKQKKYLFKAFNYTEKSKSSVLLSMVRGASGRKIGIIPENLRILEEQVNREINILIQKISNEYSSTQPDNLKINHFSQRLDVLYQQMDSLKGIYLHKYPSYFNMCNENEIVSADSLQKILKPNQIVLQYSLSKKMLITFLVSQNNFEVYKDTGVSKIYNKIDEYRKKITAFQYNDTRDSSVAAFENTAKALYDFLILPFEKYLVNKEIIIMPDDALNVISFEAFVTSKVPHSASYSYKVLNYLIQKHTVSYSYSASMFSQLNVHGNQKSIKPHLLTVAPVYNTRNFPNYYKIRDNEKDSVQIEPLPETEIEVKKIRGIMGGDILLKEKALESSFKKQAGEYNILHLASHGFVNNENPLFSRILFMHEEDTINDGYLNTFEVYTMSLNASLIVLSACNTGYGKLYKGEGVISLARGFFMAGTQDVVMTLWSVADKTSGKLMPGFYNYLSEGVPVCLALRNSKLDYLKNTDELMSHPYFWAGYVSIGNPDIAFSKPDKSQRYFSILGIILIAMGIIYIAYRKYRKKMN